MTEHANEITVTRIVLAIDTSPHGRAALEFAAELAAQLSAELQGLFVEDLDLLRLSDLPFASEVSYPTAAPRRLDRARVERALKQSAEEVRRELSQAATRRHLRWSFQVTQGQLIQTTLAAATEGDVLIVGVASRLPRMILPAAGSAGVAGAAGRGGSSRREPAWPVLVAYDGSNAGRRALAAAARLRGGTDHDLLVAISAPRQEDAPELRREASEWLRQRKIHAEIYPGNVTRGATLRDIARDERAGLIVLNRDNRLLDEAALKTLLDDAAFPVVLV